MGDLYLNPGESIVLTANKVRVNFVPFDVILTTSRLIFVDSTYARFDPQMIPLEDIFSVKGGKIATGESTITLTIARAGSPGNQESTDLLFTQQPGERRMPESKEWLRKLMESIVAVRQKNTGTDSPVAPTETGMQPSIRRWIAPEILAPHKVITDHLPEPLPETVPEPSDSVPETVEEDLPDNRELQNIPAHQSSGTDEVLSPVPEVSIQESRRGETPESAAMDEVGEMIPPGPVSSPAEEAQSLPVPIDSVGSNAGGEEGQSTEPDGLSDSPASLDEKAEEDDPEFENPSFSQVLPETEIPDDDVTGKEPDETLFEKVQLPNQEYESGNVTRGETENSPKTPVIVNWPIIPAPVIEDASAHVNTYAGEPGVGLQPEEKIVPEKNGEEITRHLRMKNEILSGSPTAHKEMEPDSRTDFLKSDEYSKEDSGSGNDQPGEIPGAKTGDGAEKEYQNHRIQEITVTSRTDQNNEVPDQSTGIGNQEISLIASPVQPTMPGDLVSEEKATPEIPGQNSLPPHDQNTPLRGRMITGIFVIIVILIALAGIAFIASTTFNDNTKPVIPPVPTPSPTPGTSPTMVSIPGNGVWVRVSYNHHYYGQLGNPGDLQEISDTGDKFYPIRNEGKFVQVRVEKQDNSGDTLRVDIYRDGTVIDSENIRTPMGEISLLIDPATGKPPVVVTQNSKP